jgi:hypothetical protein
VAEEGLLSEERVVAEGGVAEEGLLSEERVVAEGGAVLNYQPS